MKLIVNNIFSFQFMEKTICLLRLIRVSWEFVNSTTFQKGWNRHGQIDGFLRNDFQRRLVPFKRYESKRQWPIMITGGFLFDNKSLWSVLILAALFRLGIKCYLSFFCWLEQFIFHWIYFCLFHFVFLYFCLCNWVATSGQL
jgi:hypothetical protein